MAVQKKDIYRVKKEESSILNSDGEREKAIKLTIHINKKFIKDKLSVCILINRLVCHDGTEEGRTNTDAIIL